MQNEQTIHCPLCGKKVPADVDTCPFCSTPIDKVVMKRELDKVIERRVMRRVRSSKEEEAPPVPVPTAPIPEVKVTCPGCGMELKGGEAKCTRCGIPLAAEEELDDCPDCGTPFAPGAKVCPKCGVALGVEADVGTLGPSEEHPPEKAVEVPERAQTEVVTSVQVEPGPMGRGLTNGRGAINGTGLVNGTGMVNGTRGDAHGGPSRRRARGIARWQFLAVLVALVIIIPTFIYMSYSKDDDIYSVDGEFGEWDDSTPYSMSILTTTPITVVEEWSVAVDGTRAFLYIDATGDIFGTTSVESFFLFIDSDGDETTGYAVGSLGADFMVELDGWNGSVQSSDVSVYDPASATDRYDWNSWESLGGAASRLVDDRMEAMGNLQEAPSADARFLLLSQDQQARRSVSAGVPYGGSVLTVTQRLSSTVPLSGVVPVSGSEAILTLEFTCDGAEGTVDSVDVQLESLPPVVSAFEAFTIQPGEVVTVDFEVDTSSLSPAQFVAASVSAADISSSFTRTEVFGHPARAYVGSAPSSVIIDGAFGDWTGRTASDVDLVEVLNPNIDIRSVGVFNTSLSSSFYISVAGEVCSGSYVPVMKGKPVPSSGGGTVVPITRKTAEDITRVFIDSDMSAATGYALSVDSKVIGADYRIEVRGLNGEVVSSVLHEYTGTTWSLVSADVPAEVDFQKMEVGVLANNIGGAVDIDFVIETTDWRQYKDYVALDEATMLALTGGISSSVGTLAWAVDSATSDEATSSSFQRKLFYDGTNFWSLYYDGSHTMYRYSSNGGVNWTDGGQVFTTTGVKHASLWYDSSGSAVYVVGDTGVASVNVFVRKGSVTPSSHTITWGNEKLLPMSSNPMAGKFPFASLDADGYVWVVSISKVHATQEQYRFRSFVSDGVGDVEGTWTDKGNIVNQNKDSSLRGCLVPGLSGSGVVVWSVFTYQGIVGSSGYTGTAWSTPVTIYAGGASADNSLYAPPSAVVDSRGVVHVVYGTGDMAGSAWAANIQYVYNTSADTWSTPITLNGVGGGALKYPTISMDSTTDNVFAMWVDDGMSADSIVVKKNASGTWSFLTVAQTSYTKTYLTSILSAPGEAYVCFQWTQNTTSPYEVMFDKIPEFTDVVVPVLFVLTMFIAIYRRRSRQEEPE